MPRHGASTTTIGSACATTSAVSRPWPRSLPSLRPGQVIIYHAWEPYQYKNHKSYGTLTPSPFNPLSVAGGYTHLQPMPDANTAGPSDRDTRVEVELIRNLTS